MGVNRRISHSFKGRPKKKSAAAAAATTKNQEGNVHTARGGEGGICTHTHKPKKYAKVIHVYIVNFLLVEKKKEDLMILFTECTCLFLSSYRLGSRLGSRSSPVSRGNCTSRGSLYSDGPPKRQLFYSHTHGRMVA